MLFEIAVLLMSIWSLIMCGWVSRIVKRLNEFDRDLSRVSESCNFNIDALWQEVKDLKEI